MGCGALQDDGCDEVLLVGEAAGIVTSRHLFTVLLVGSVAVTRHLLVRLRMVVLLELDFQSVMAAIKIKPISWQFTSW